MLKVVVQVVVWTAIMAAVIIGPARTLEYPGGWVFVGIFFVGGLAITLWMARYSPSLLRERMSSPVQRDQKPWDRVFLSSFIVLFFVWLAFMGWDARRTGFQAVPAWLQVAGGVAVVLYMGGVWLTFRENAFAAPVVKIQQDQKVIDTGPYAVVRHPMYASTLLFAVGLPLLLGSLFGLIGGAAIIAGIAWRAVREEGTLRRELPGYAAYAERVRFRFVPRVW